MNLFAIFVMKISGKLSFNVLHYKLSGCITTIVKLS